MSHTEATAKSIDELLRDVKAGKVRVPQFERNFCWQEQDVLDLFDSIYRGYPIGSLIFWVTDKVDRAEARFGPLQFSTSTKDVLLVIDGQQRLTTLVATLLREREPTSTEDKVFLVYLDLESGTFKVPGPGEEPPHHWLPLNEIVDTVRYLRWLAGLPKGSKYDQWTQAANEAVLALRHYRVPVYILRSDDEAEVRSIFVRINAGGRPLEADEIFQAIKGDERKVAPSPLESDLAVLQRRYDRFLNYDARVLLQAYAGERPVTATIPYTVIADQAALAEPIEIHVEPRYERSHGDRRWSEASKTGYQALLQTGRPLKDDSVIRVKRAEVVEGRLTLTVQQARYLDQARSNMILDFDRDAPRARTSLRSQLAEEYRDRLPDLADERLANTLGVSCLLFYRHNGLWTPYLVRRATKVAVSPGGINSTASGAAKWPMKRGPKTFSDYATTSMLTELQEEVGIEPKDLNGHLLPVALCREMLRGGKPQLFYVGFTELARGELLERRRNARGKAKKEGQVVEAQPDRSDRAADFVLMPGSLAERRGRFEISLECAAALHFAYQYARAHPDLGMK